MINAEMYQMAMAARMNAHAPYSQFKVGVCLQAGSGKFYIGCNVENAAYGQTQCAEAGAIGNMISHGDRHIKSVLIVTDTDNLTPPCGGCRQRLSEFATDSTEIYLCNLQGKHMRYTFQELYPHMFGASNLDTAHKCND